MSVVITKFCLYAACRRKGEALLLSEFHKQSTGKFGHKPVCKECCGIRNKQWRSDPKVLQRNKEIGKIYYTRPEIREHRKQTTRTYRNQPKEKYKLYIRSAKRRCLVFEIDADFAISLFLSNCYYCNNGPNPLNGIDRINNDKGYTVENCVSCCKMCNEIKLNHSTEEILIHLQKIIDHMKQKMPIDGK